MNNFEQNPMLRDIIEKQLPFLDLSRREKRILRKRREGMLLLAIGSEEKPSLTRERVRQILLEAGKKEQDKEKIIKSLISKIKQYYAKNNTSQVVSI
jgi:hypothetical protein